MTPTIVPASFRDPAGFVWADGEAIYRHVAHSAQTRYDNLMSTGLYDELVEAGLLISHREVDVPSPRPGAYKVLQPEVIPFISYPYEWCFSQLKDAALLTLEVQKRAMRHGMWLHDASAYNVQFGLASTSASLRSGGRPVLIDTLSFEPVRKGEPWLAYGQFCRHFLAPLALMAHCDARLSDLLRSYIDGVPIDLASKLLPRRTRRSPGLLAHIHAQARLQRRTESSGKAPVSPKREISARGLEGIIRSLAKTVGKLEWKAGRTTWSDYYEEASHYSEGAQKHKTELVGRYLDEAGGSVVWDLGGNVGVFSRLACERGSQVVCFDIDPGCVEANYRRVREEGEELILPLVCDLRNPAPSLGWAGRERSSLADRGPADVVMALALVHHLAIANNVPLAMIAEYFAALGKKLIIEFVPKSDSRVQQLLALRDDIFDDYHQEGFEKAFGSHFEIERREQLSESDRLMYLMSRRNN
jgi:hypothetical protein